MRKAGAERARSAFVEATMAKMFYEFEEARAALGVSHEELEEMVSLGELSKVTVGTKRRLVRVRDVEAVLKRVRSGGRLRTKREFRGSSVAGAAERAAAFLGVAPGLVSFKILERADDRAPDTEAREARIAVDLSEFAPQNGETENTVPRVEERAQETPEPVAAENKGRTGGARLYYAPEQAARLLDVSRHEVNLWIYRRELRTVNINGYRWVPKEALDEMLAELLPPATETPPEPFLMLTVPKDEAEAPGLGTEEVKQGDAMPDPRFLVRKVEELEKRIEGLKQELRLKEAR